MDFNLGDQPITDIRYDDVTGDLYASTDFSVLRLPDGGLADPRRARPRRSPRRTA